MSEVTVKQAYEWVKTGHWNLTQFTEWFDTLESDVRAEGYSSGYSEGYNDAEYDAGEMGSAI